MLRLLGFVTDPGAADLAKETPATGTAGVNGALWGTSAQDWTQVQEGQFTAGFDAVPDHCSVAPDTDYLDAGCGAGMAAMLAAGRGARGLVGADAVDGAHLAARIPFRQADGGFRIEAACRFLFARA
jgi:hypothetical protein